MIIIPINIKPNILSTRFVYKNYNHNKKEYFWKYKLLCFRLAEITKQPYIEVRKKIIKLI